MSHDLQMVDGKAQMAYVGEVPWHTLGTKMEGNPSPRQMMKAAGLDWEVEMVQAEISMGGKILALPDDYACVRLTGKAPKEEDILTTGSKNWMPVQNKDAFDFFAKFVKEGSMTMETAGALGHNGNMVWAMARLTEAFKVFKGDDISPYLLFSNPFKYGKAIDVRLCFERVVCANTMAIALGEKGSNVFRISHVQQFDPKKAEKTLGLSKEAMDSFKDQAQFLGSVSYKDELLKEYFAEVFPNLTKDASRKKELSRPATMAMEVVETQPGADIRPNTWWQAFNAVTYLTNHKLSDNRVTSANSLLYGPNQKRNVDAFALALDYAEKD